MLKQILQRWKSRKAAPTGSDKLCTALLCADVQGLTLLTENGDEVRVDFAVAARAYHAENRRSSRKCVGDRDVIAKRFDFAGDAKITLHLNTVADFNAVRTAIQSAGYTTFDLT